MSLFKVRVYINSRLYVGWVFADSQRSANAYGRMRARVGQL